MDEAAGDHEEVSGTCLNGLPATLTELDRDGSRDHVDDCVVPAVVVPAAHEAWLGRREPRPQAGLREGLPTVDLGRTLDLDEFVRCDEHGVLYWLTRPPPQMPSR